MSNIVQTSYNDIAVSFTEDGWINATAVAEKFGKRVDNWLANQETKDYIEALADFHDHATEREPNTRKVGDSNTLKVRDVHTRKVRYVKTSKARADRGGGTWLHPDLAVSFGRWLDVRFAVWCDQHIKQFLSGTHPHYDWKKLRHQATASYKVMNQILQMTRQRLGKTCAPHHFSNEARLVNWALTGAFGKVDREGLSPGDLDLLAKLENMDTVLIGCGAPYAERKQELERFAAEQRVAHTPALEPCVAAAAQPRLDQGA